MKSIDELKVFSNEIKGKFILHYNNKEHILKPGNFLAVDAKQLHSEKTSSSGATILIGKKYKN